MISIYEHALAESPFITKRRDSSARSQQEAEFDDIIGMLDLVDRSDSDPLANVSFVAAKLDRLPKYGPEELNLYALRDRQSSTDIIVTELKDKVQNLESSKTIDMVQMKVNELNAMLDNFNSNICNQLAETKQVCSAITTNALDKIGHVSNQLSTQIEQIQQACARMAEPTASVPSPESTNNNSVVLYGIDENRDINVWRDKVADVLQFIVGRSVAVNDMLRLGRYSADRKRPILIKLFSAWDCRLLTSGARKLKDYSSRVYLKRDEPLTARRKATFERLKYRAEREQKEVVVVNDQLIIDGITVFTLQSGFVDSNNGSVSIHNG